MIYIMFFFLGIFSGFLLYVNLFPYGVRKPQLCLPSPDYFSKINKKVT